MTNLDKLTEKDGGLRKEQNGVTLGIDKGKNTGITIVKHDPQTVLSVQLDRAETAKLVAYLGGKDLLTDAVKSYESLQNDCVERMEELRGTIRELAETLTQCNSVMNTLHGFDGIDTGPFSKLISLSIEKARKQLEG